jgi:hypothetical protein
MPRHTEKTVTDLRAAIDCLPRRTREAMLDGVRANKVIVGAYTDRDGGVCPMLAAHRHGGRTDFVGFARAWDAYTGAHPSRKRARRAKPRELRQLTALLETSLGLQAPPTPLGGVVAEHQAMARDRRAREAEGTGGWGFLRRLRGAPAPQPAAEAERELVEV